MATLSKTKELSTQFSASLFSSLDEVGMRAVIATMEGMLAGQTNEEALAAGNKILVAAGRKPVVIPFQKPRIRILLSTRLGERRWTQADLARMTGIRPSTINDLYHEIAERVNLEHLDLICEALDCDLSDLISYIPPRKAHTSSRWGTHSF